MRSRHAPAVAIALWSFASAACEAGGGLEGQRPATSPGALDASLDAAHAMQAEAMAPLASDGSVETAVDALSSDGACRPVEGLELVTVCDDGGAPDASPGQPDAEADAQTDAVPEPDATIDAGGEADAQVDAADVDAALPPDEGYCAQRSDECSLGRAEIVLGSATCEISGQRLRVSREMCEVCDQQASILGYAITIMDCNVCEHVFSSGWSPGFFDGTFGAHACRERSDDVDLSRTRADRDCVDVYASVNNGEQTAGGGHVSRALDRVRVCRCDRSTDTCMPCLDGSCDGF